MKNILTLFACCLMALGLAAYLNPPLAHAQGGGSGVLGPVEFGTSNPSGNCSQSFLELVVNRTTGAVFSCVNGAWGQSNLTIGGTVKLTAIPSASGTRYLCVGTDGTVTSSASACSGT